MMPPQPHARLFAPIELAGLNARNCIVVSLGVPDYLQLLTRAYAWWLARREKISEISAPAPHGADLQHRVEHTTGAKQQ